MKSTILFIVFTIFSLHVQWGSTKENNLRDIYSKLNATEKRYFSEYFLTKGCLEDSTGRVLSLSSRQLAFPTDIVEKFESLDIPKSFPVTFVHKVMSTYQIGKPDVLRLARGDQICIEGLGCIDPGDAGNICCT